MIVTAVTSRPPNDGAPGCPLDSVQHFSSTDLNASLFCLRSIVKLFRIGHCIIDLGVSFIGTKRLKCSAGHSGLAACILDHNLQWRNNSQILFPSFMFRWGPIYWNSCLAMLDMDSNKMYCLLSRHGTVWSDYQDSRFKPCFNVSKNLNNFMSEEILHIYTFIL